MNEEVLPIFRLTRVMSSRWGVWMKMTNICDFPSGGKIYCGVDFTSVCLTFVFCGMKGKRICWRSFIWGLRSPTESKLILEAEILQLISFILFQRPSVLPSWELDYIFGFVGNQIVLYRDTLILSPFLVHVLLEIREFRYGF